MSYRGTREERRHRFHAFSHAAHAAADFGVERRWYERVSERPGTRGVGRRPRRRASDRPDLELSRLARYACVFLEALRAAVISSQFGIEEASNFSAEGRSAKRKER